jgi:fructokinase
MFRVGIDLGGTKIEGIVLDEDGRELFRKRIETQQAHGYRHTLNRIRFLYDELAAHIRGEPHTFGIGTPGAISPLTGMLRNSNTVCLNGRPFRTDLEQILGRKIGLQNDANCFALAEALYGAGKGRKLVFGVILGTGCGGGIVYKDELITGPQAIAGEWGHTSINPAGPVCYCGQRGCVETYISGSGVEARYAGSHGEKRAFSEIANDYGRREPRAVETITTFFRNFGRSMANLIDVLDPDIVVLGGGVSKFDAIYSEGVVEVARCVFSDSLETPIVKHQLKDSAGVIGAALIGI